MPSDPSFLCEIENVFRLVGRVALVSSTDYDCEISDLSDWLRGPECRGIKDPNDLPNGLTKQTMLAIYNSHKRADRGSIYPMWGIWTRKTHRTG